MGDLGVTNGHLSLPDKNSEDVFLDLATPEEILAQLHANNSEWKGALPSVDAYLRREEYLGNQDLTKDGGLTSWSLVYQPPGGKRQALCGCETIKKRALVGKNGKVEEVVSHGLGSVFTPLPNRGKGFVRRMMTELAKRLKTWQMNNGKRVLFSALWSDIGKRFYAAHGFQPFPSAHVSLPVAPTVADGLPTVRRLTSSDLPELCALDEEVLRQSLVEYKDANRSAVALVPDYTTMRWHHAREEFVANELFGRHPEVKGAITGEPGSRVWCYWTRVWKDPQDDEPNTLHILRLASEDESQSDFAAASPDGVEQAKNSSATKAIAALCAAAQTEAALWDMGEIQIWNPNSTVLAAAQLIDPTVKVQHRENDSIPSLLWYGEGSWEHVDWISNEKFAWC